MPFGLTDDSFNGIESVFSAFHKIVRVHLFGSRALGRERPGSDIDLALEGAGLTFNDQLELRIRLDNLMLPYRFDLVILDDQIDDSLRNHIERVGIVIYQKQG
ncbi:MAG: nucleotidyltransferase domain-containing protein [Pseudomonadota bacterium]|nr:nucleotidyltransferase domain-containing protein [Pseudomonadota bacterium]